MDGEYLLDTNIVVAVLGDEPVVRRYLTERPRVSVSVTVLGELYFGAFKSAKLNENLIRINDLLSEVKILDCDGVTAYEYGSIRNELRLKGRPIPENDIWIAAAARRHRLTLVSRDQHFAEIERLNWEQW